MTVHSPYKKYFKGVFYEQQRKVDKSKTSVSQELQKGLIKAGLPLQPWDVVNSLHEHFHSTVDVPFETAAQQSPTNSTFFFKYSVPTRIPWAFVYIEKIKQFKIVENCAYGL